MIVEKLKKILEDLCEAESDAQKCDNGNASAGRRLRKISMSAIKELRELRNLVLEHTKK